MIEIEIKKDERTGLECNTILYIWEHGEDGWEYAYYNYCELCPANSTCNILKGKAKIITDAK